MQIRFAFAAADDPETPAGRFAGSRIFFGLVGLCKQFVQFGFNFFPFGFVHKAFNGCRRSDDHGRQSYEIYSDVRAA
jgi:hypothetical protein